MLTAVTSWWLPWKATYISVKQSIRRNNTQLHPDTKTIISAQQIPLELQNNQESKEYFFLGAYPGSLIAIRNDGFISIPERQWVNFEDPNNSPRVLFHDWQGKMHWQITLPRERTKWDYSPYRQYGVSPDGHVIAHAIISQTHPVEHRLLVNIWKNGKELGRIRLPSMGETAPTLTVMNNGKVLLNGGIEYVEETLDISPVNLMLIQDSKLLASGRYVPSKIINGSPATTRSICLHASKNLDRLAFV